MTLMRSLDGYYDEKGQWQRTKFCFIDCKERCTCRPPSKVFLKPSLEESITQAAEQLATWPGEVLEATKFKAPTSEN